MLFDFLIGAALAVPFSVIARSLSENRANLVYAAGLILAALVYVAFAAAGGASTMWLAFEVCALLLYAVLAWVGLRRSIIALAIGWAAHVAWDLVVHVRGAGAQYTPDWYPWVCAGFDLVVAIAIIARYRDRWTYSSVRSRT